MTHGKYDEATRPIIRCERDHNSIVDHGLRGPYTYLFMKNGSYYEATKGTDGTLAFGGVSDAGGATGTSCHSVLNAAIQACSQGAKIFIKSGTYTLTASVIDNIGVTLEGEHGAGDLFFSDDGTHGGYENKNGVLFYDSDAAGIDMFKIGYKTVGAANTLTFGPRLKNMSFTGYATVPGIYSDTKDNCAVKCSNIQCGQFENLAFYHKEYGLYVTATNDEVPLNYTDVNLFHYLLFAYNKRGLYISGAGGNSRVENIWSYINHYNGVYVANYYDIKIRNIMSNADGWDNATPGDGAGVRVACTYGNAVIENVDVVGANNGTGQFTYTGLTLDPSGFKAHGKIWVHNLLVQGTDSHAIHIAAGGLAGTSVFIRDLYCGSPDTENVYGGAANSGDVGGACVYNDSGLTTKVYVNGGYADCEQADVQGSWFKNCYSVKNVENFNPTYHGGGADIFDDTNDLIGFSCALDATTPTASTVYTVNGGDLIVTSTDSGNADCSITIRDGGNATVQAGLSRFTHLYIPLGYDVNWGAYTGAAPTVTIHGV